MNRPHPFSLFALPIVLLLLVIVLAPAQAQSRSVRQLHGAEAQRFLAREGILEQIQSAGGGAASLEPAQGRSFLVLRPGSASDYDLGDQFGVSVALDGDTLVVGAAYADIGPNSDQGAAYVFVRSATGAWLQQQKLVAGDGDAGAQFGSSVALNEDSLIVGAHMADIGAAVDQGAAYMFTRAGSTWSQQQKLTSSDGQAGDRFGVAVTLDGNTAVVGASLANVGPNGDQGAAYAYVRSGTMWSQQQKLIAGDGAAGDRFGNAVAVDGNSAIVGAHYADVGAVAIQGAAYVFFRAGSVWTQQQKLTASDGAGGDFFGTSVDLDGPTTVVGANYANVGGNIDAGAAYVFEYSGANWNQQQKLTAYDGAPGDQFGRSVTLEEDTAVIGIPYDDVFGNLNRGSARVFVRENTFWEEHQKLIAGDGAADDAFSFSLALSGDNVVVGAFGATVGGMADAGKLYTTARGPVPWPESSQNTANDGAADDLLGYSVALDGDTAVVGAYLADGSATDQGAAYVFIRNGPIWVQEQKLTASDGAFGDWFGFSVDVDGDTVLVGARQANISLHADQGAAYVYVRTGGVWSEQQKLVAGDGAAGDAYGSAVALDGDTAMVGAPTVDFGANGNQGAAYVYLRTANSWLQQQKLSAGDGGAGDHFGSAVALDGNSALVGAFFADVGGRPDQGAAYVFTRAGVVWSQQQKLVAGDGAEDDYFGFPVAISGNTALMGADGADIGGNNDQGAAYVFLRSGGNWSQQQKLLAPDGADGDYFGISVALSEDTAIVGAYAAGVATNPAQGTAYVFSRFGSVWMWEQKLIAGNGKVGVGAAFDWFGYSVALDGDTALVGAPLADYPLNLDQGRVHFFQRAGMAGYRSYAPLVLNE